MALSGLLRKALENSNLTFEELRAFELGLQYLTDHEQEEFARIVTENPKLIYPLYINFKTKLHAVTQDEDAWQQAVEQEIVELEELMEKRRVGDELF